MQHTDLETCLLVTSVYLHQQQPVSIWFVALLPLVISDLTELQRGRTPSRQGSEPFRKVDKLNIHPGVFEGIVVIILVINFVTLNLDLSGDMWATQQG